MVTLQSRWKRPQTSHVRLYISIGVFVVIGITAALLARAVPALLKQVGALAAPPEPAVAPTNETSARPLPELKDYQQFGRVFTVLGYRIDLPEDFYLDVLPQPTNVPRGGRFTGLRFRGSLGDAAQIQIVVVDYAGDQSGKEDSGVKARLEAALERLFARLTHNASMSRLTRGEMTFPEVHGIPCVRTGFSGDFRDDGKKWRVHRSGTALVTVEPHRDVYLYSLWEGSTEQELRNLLAASLLTLRQAEQKTNVRNEPSGAAE